MTLRPGEVVGLIGPNGAGKTTFIDAVDRIRAIDRRDPARRSARRSVVASASCGGRHRAELPDARALREHDGAREPAGGVRTLVMAPLISAISSGRGARRSHRPPSRRCTSSVSSPTWTGGRTSCRTGGGGWSRSRAVAAESSVLLLDEPAAGLGDDETAELGELIRRLARDWGLAVLLVEHDVGLVLDVCDRVVVLDRRSAARRRHPRGDPSRARGDRRVPRGTRRPLRRGAWPGGDHAPCGHERCGTPRRDEWSRGRVRRPRRGARPRPRGACGRGGRTARPERRGQDDDALDDRRRAARRLRGR